MSTDGIDVEEQDLVIFESIVMGVCNDDTVESKPSISTINEIDQNDGVSMTIIHKDGPTMPAPEEINNTVATEPTFTELPISELPTDVVTDPTISELQIALDIANAEIEQYKSNIVELKNNLDAVKTEAAQFKLEIAELKTTLEKVNIDLEKVHIDKFNEFLKEIQELDPDIDLDFVKTIATSQLPKFIETLKRTKQTVVAIEDEVKDLSEAPTGCTFKKFIKVIFK
jgi:hypothetical protein